MAQPSLPFKGLHADRIPPAGVAARPEFLLESQRANRRRLRVFLGTLIISLAVSLAFTWSRPPEYRASASLEITPATYTPPPATGQVTGTIESARPFLTEVQVITSRPVVEQAAALLTRSGYDLSSFGSDAVAGIQAHLQADPVPGTNIVELVAAGRQAELLAPLVGAVVGTYQDRLAEAYRTASSESLSRADDEVVRLEQSVAAKRREVEAYRLRNNIVSLERDENEVLARVRNLSTSLSTANEKVATAEGKVRALEAAATTGKTAVRARDDPTLANLEQRASQAREELRDLERDFTPEYMAKDPKVIALRARLAELDRQIAAQRKTSQETALVEAQQELAGSQAAVARIQGQMASTRQEASQFAARFDVYRARAEELEQLGKAQREAVQRRAQLEATERSRMPALKVLEAASVPHEPWRPLYWRDSAISISASIALALLAMWLVELFNRREPQPAVVLIQPQPGTLPFEPLPQMRASDTRMLSGASIPPRLAGAEPSLLPQQPRFPRELRQDEITALVRAADDQTRLAVLLLLTGISSEEALRLVWSDVDADRGVIRVGDGSGRDVVVGEALRRCLADRKGPASEFVLGTAGRASSREAIDAQLLCSAHDADIESATEVTSEALRHTYIAFLVRQRIRFSDLTRLVGPLPVEAVAAYSSLAPTGARVASTVVKLEYPGLYEAPEQPSESAGARLP